MLDSLSITSPASGALSSESSSSGLAIMTPASSQAYCMMFTPVAPSKYRTEGMPYFGISILENALPPVSRSIFSFTDISFNSSCIEASLINLLIFFLLFY